MAKLTQLENYTMPTIPYPKTLHSKSVRNPKTLRLFSYLHLTQTRYNIFEINVSSILLKNDNLFLVSILYQSVCTNIQISRLSKF